MVSIRVSPCVATSLTVRWLAHAPQPIAKQVYSATCFLSSSYAGTKECSSQSAPSVSRPSATWSVGSQCVFTSCAHEVYCVPPDSWLAHRRSTARSIAALLSGESDTTGTRAQMVSAEQWKPTMVTRKVSLGEATPASTNCLGSPSNFSHASLTSWQARWRLVCGKLPWRMPMLPLRSTTSTTWMTLPWAFLRSGSVLGAVTSTSATPVSFCVGAQQSTLACACAVPMSALPTRSVRKSKSLSLSFMKRKRRHGGCIAGVVSSMRHGSSPVGLSQYVGSPRRSASSLAAARDGRPSLAPCLAGGLTMSSNGTSLAGGCTAKSEHSKVGSPLRFGIRWLLRSTSSHESTKCTEKMAGVCGPSPPTHAGTLTVCVYACLLTACRHAPLLAEALSFLNVSSAFLIGSYLLLSA